MALKILTAWNAYWSVDLPLMPADTCWSAADLIMRLPGVDFAGCLAQGVLA